jgi:hypothetical protein
MLYRPVSTSHGGKTRGGRADAATAEAMDGVEEKESQVGVLQCRGCVDNAQRVRDNAGENFKGGSRRGHQRRLCESFYRWADRA